MLGALSWPTDLGVDTRCPGLAQTVGIVDSRKVEWCWLSWYQWERSQQAWCQLWRDPPNAALPVQLQSWAGATEASLDALQTSVFAERCASAATCEGLSEVATALADRTDAEGWVCGRGRTAWAQQSAGVEKRIAGQAVPPTARAAHDGCSWRLACG